MEQEERSIEEVMEEEAMKEEGAELVEMDEVRVEGLADEEIAGKFNL